MFYSPYRQKLLPPPGYDLFTWKTYLDNIHAYAAPKQAFYHFNKPPKPQELNGWKIGLKLEAVGKKTPF